MDGAEVHESSTSLDVDTDWEGMRETYLKLLECGSEVCRIRGTILLGKRSKIAPETVLEPLVPILVEHLDVAQFDHPRSIQEAAAYCIMCFARRSDNLCRLIGQSGAVQHLLRLLVQSEAGHRKTLARSLREIIICSSQNRMILIRHNGLQVVISLMDSSSGTTRRCFAEILSAMAMLRDMRRAIVGTGSLPLLIEAAGVGVMASRARAVTAIGMIGRTRTSRQLLVDAGVIPVLVGLMREGDPTLKIVAANTLGIVSAHVDFIRPVALAGAIPLIVELLEGTESIGKEIAEDVLCVLAVAEENAVAIAAHMVTILRQSNDAAKAAAVDVLWDLSSYKHSIPVVRVSGAVPLLLENLQVGTAEIRERVSGAVAQLSYDEDDRRALADAGVIPILMRLLRDESEEVKDNAAEALINFSEDPLLRERISEAFDTPTFQDTVNRLVRIHRTDEHINQSLRRMADEQLAREHEYG
ncbi:U-box domain-containing protein 13 [Nymphaea colorata]|uniref:Armadillo repeat-containing domain-containing protein n=1 Tax=Nymphaea colorata TaxID=210225 RepID=A0A5K1F725_9MAGN|nr:U-box domain-containing protein 13 [Nymphaea colorata]XP_049934750.1 U-box domain-containing protein 13 [Nymphaea colorata]VVW60311.1 unnamed protein product [Nymphaea colorata]